jgi:hypothetical protein
MVGQLSSRSPERCTSPLDDSHKDRSIFRFDDSKVGLSDLMQDESLSETPRQQTQVLLKEDHEITIGKLIRLPVRYAL